MPKKSRQKFKYLENEKAFNMKEKAFFIIFEGLSLKQIKKIMEGESPNLIFYIAIKTSYYCLKDHYKFKLFLVIVPYPCPLKTL